MKTAALLLLFCAAASAAEDCYRIETIAVPPHVSLEVGGLDFLPDGRLLISTRRGEIWALRDGQWKRWATGLDEAMGLCVTGKNEAVVAQRPELTRIRDSDGDGEADTYETLADQWNYSGHIYEWTFGPVRDAAGNFYCTLACWHFPKPPAKHAHYSGAEIGPPAGYVPNPAPQWRGWSFRVTPQGAFEPWASGLRSPNGLGLSPDGDLFITDNQGEYFGSCVMMHAPRGAFLGHPEGLAWGPDSSSDPFAVPLPDLDKRRMRPAVQFPYGIAGQSSSQPLMDASAGKFGPFAGQWFIGEQTQSTLLRVALEKVNGAWQGAVFPFMRGFQCGVNRLVFAADGSLWAGQTQRGWGSVGAAQEGLQHVVWNGQTPFEIQTMKLTKTGFVLRFTQPAEAKALANPANYALHHFHYAYHRAYGSPLLGDTPTPVQAVKPAPDGRSVELVLGDLAAGGEIYALQVNNLTTAAGAKPLRNNAAYYTLNRLPAP
jgi:hypothetical protein